MMEWKKIQTGEPAAACNHLTVPMVPTNDHISCSTPATWRAKTLCGCGAIHTDIMRCDDHRISDLEEEITRTKKTVEGVVRYARTLNPDIRTNEECVLFAAGYHQTPRDNGDELWRSLNTRDVAEAN